MSVLLVEVEDPLVFALVEIGALGEVECFECALDREGLNSKRPCIGVDDGMKLLHLHVVCQAREDVLVVRLSLKDGRRNK